MSDKLVLHSTQKGFISQYFWALVWGGALLALALWCGHLIESAYTTLGVASYGEFNNLNYCQQTNHNDKIFFSYVGMILSYVIVGIIALRNVYISIYNTREINVISKNKGEHWGNLYCDKYDFPFSKKSYDLTFDRIIKITVEQPSISRLVNTGTLNLHTVTFTNADSQKGTWGIPAIKDPYGKKAEIEEFLADHKGLKIDNSD